MVFVQQCFLTTTGLRSICMCMLLTFLAALELRILAYKVLQYDFVQNIMQAAHYTNRQHHLNCLRLSIYKNYIKPM